MQIGQTIEGIVNVDLIKEHSLEKVVNEYIPDEDDLYSWKVDNICTVQQLEIFYKTLILDMYRRENNINYTYQDNIEKRYFVVPLRLSKQVLD